MTELGLLREERREGGKVFLQLVAREFRFRSNLLPPLDGEGGMGDVQALAETFSKAYEDLWSRMHQRKDRVIFGDRERPAPPLPPPDAPSSESHPPHLGALTLRLTPQRYRRLVRVLSALLDEVASEGVPESGEACTFTRPASRGAPQHDPAHFSASAAR